jgi:hypothetical protein
MMSSAARVELESLLRARKLDVTLTSAAPWIARARDAAPTSIAGLDAALGGGLPRGHLSEIIGPRSSGRTTIVCRMLAAAAARGEAVAMIDACDRFDPVSADAAGVDLAKLLWVRDTGDAARALKALTLVLQAGGFGLVAFDLADVPDRLVRQFPYTTWMRIARSIEGSPTSAVIVASGHVARSPGGVTIGLGDPAGSRAQWAGTSDRGRFLQGLDVRTRIIGGR